MLLCLSGVYTCPLMRSYTINNHSQVWFPATVSKDVLLRNRGREGPKCVAMRLCTCTWEGSELRRWYIYTTTIHLWIPCLTYLPTTTTTGW